MTTRDQARLRVESLRRRQVGPVSFALTSGECLAITGASGAGKSVILRMIADLDPHEGEAWLDNRPRAAMPPPVWRRRVVHVPAESGWWLDTVREHFDRFPDADAAALGLPADIGTRAIASCSTGERQRLALVRAIAVAPLVLLLDEPTAALDAATAARVEELLRTQLAAGTTLVLVSHDAEQASRLGTRHARVHDGRFEWGAEPPV
ncbi:ABC transporter ATP-binding protein [Rhizosaccharibacter radicis]|uniref:ABC transporter ATP-binding protein n=1 Tax=Rhizosaccharibacter radicis TaxID=2782605 RepID=A0ABT1VTQ7_9PROT|nr:ABC transporter ATP-binding protein [Acetobacteraceae bacterium KSS12]